MKKNKTMRLIWTIGLLSTLSYSCTSAKDELIPYDYSYLPKPTPDAEGSGVLPPKELYIPKGGIWDVPWNNNFNDPASKYSLSRKIETRNFAMLWDAQFGADLVASTGANPNNTLGFLERTYDYFSEELKFLEHGNSLTDKYKMIVFVRGGEDQTAYGGGAMDSVGILWMPSTRLGAPYTTLAHELGHSFQYMVKANGQWGFSNNTPGSNGQAIWEMTSQFMTMMVYPEWMTIENWHLVSFMENTHLAFMHENMRYASPYVLLYWTDKYGLDFVSKIWRQSVRPEDPVATYKRIQGKSQEQFNDEMFDAYRKFITWDLSIIRATEKSKYANQHTTKMSSIGNNWYRITPEKAPQNYGYNGIRLNIPTGNAAVTVDFKGVAGAAGYRAIKTDKAGWRYGFVAYQANGNRVYSDTFSAKEGTANFTVPPNTTYLWLVVSGAPTEHWEHLWDENTNNDEQWPYEIKVNGTTLHASAVQ